MGSTTMDAEPWVGSWRPHRPRGPIAALYSSPGPKYGLPTNVGFNLHDPSRHRAPAYSFGVRAKGVQKHRSPGPAYLVPPGTTAKGKDGIPAYSICSRPRDLLHFNTPGPGHYCPERATNVTFPTAPACSLGYRTRHSSTSKTPGPATYCLPPMLGPHIVGKSSAPNYSMLGRNSLGTFYEDHSKTPGPCGYAPVPADVYKQRAPRFSMLGRTPHPGDPTPKPAPNAYSPEQQRRQQGPTFGIRHSPYLVSLIAEGLD